MNTRIHILGESAPAAHPETTSPKGCLLIIDDDEKLSRLLSQYLEREGYQVSTASDGKRGLELARARMPDLILLDIRMPGMDGLELLKRLRAHDEVPTLIMTAQNSDIKQILSFKLGADGYITKPFCAEALAAQVESMLRRRDVVRRADASEVMRLGNVTVDQGKREVHVGGRLAVLTNKEFDVLCALLKAEGRVLSREELLDQVWDVGVDKELITRTVDQHIARLRKELGPEGHRILTVQHLGYRIQTE